MAQEIQPGTQPHLFEGSVRKTVTKARGITASARKTIQQARSAVKRSRDLCNQAAKAMEISRRFLDSVNSEKPHDRAGGDFFLDNLGEQMVKLAICLSVRKSNLAASYWLLAPSPESYANLG